MPVERYKTGPGTLTIGEVGTTKEFATQVTSVVLTPEVDAEDDVKVLSGDIVPGEETETFNLSGSLYQDLKETGVVEYTWDNAGAVLPFTFTPNTALGATVTGDVRIRRLAIGGDVDADATSDFEFPVVGTPVFTAAVVGP